MRSQAWQRSVRAASVASGFPVLPEEALAGTVIVGNARKILMYRLAIVVGEAHAGAGGVHGGHDDAALDCVIGKGKGLPDSGPGGKGRSQGSEVRFVVGHEYVGLSRFNEGWGCGGDFGEVVAGRSFEQRSGRRSGRQGEPSPEIHEGLGGPVSES